MERLSGGRVTSVNNAFSAVRCAFRLLFGRSLQPGEIGITQFVTFGSRDMQCFDSHTAGNT